MSASEGAARSFQSGMALVSKSTAISIEHEKAAERQSVFRSGGVWRSTQAGQSRFRRTVLRPVEDRPIQEEVSMKAAISAVLAGVGLMGLVALAPVSAYAMPVATSGVHAEAQGLADGLTQVRWHGHHNWHHSQVM
eukprot:gene27729-30718_t